MQTNELVKELSTNFIEYAVAVNSDRSIPDAKCGLKPVARRILWGAYDGGYTSSKEHAKCARIVGDVMGRWHPHGDSSIYGALVRMSQPWIMRYPLIDFHGNMGNIDGDGPAAYRYTNARLAKISEDGLLSGIKKKVVDFIPNYDENDFEPITLPSIFPNLLCNPNSGIGVAMACNWAPHNLTEVAQAIYDFIDGKEPMLPGPDFPTGGVVINKDDIPNIMKTGRGSVKVRGKYKIEKNCIIFYEIPYEVKTENLLKEIGDLCDSKEIEGIVDIRNESGKKGLRIVLECEKAMNPESLLPKLFAKTSLQISFSYNQIALVDKTPVELNLKQCIEIYVKHNISCLIKSNQYDLNKAKDRLEIVDGLLKALEDIDNIIALIKSSESAAAAQKSLISKYKFTEAQAKAIVDMKLGRLAGLEKIELNQESKDLHNEIDRILKFLSDETLQKEELKRLLSELVKKYGDKRRTELAQIETPKADKEIETVTPEDCVVIMTKDGYIKRIPTAAFKVQKRNGKGVKSDDIPLGTISTNTIDTLMLFTNQGKMYRLLVDSVPVGTNASKGVNINSIIKMDTSESVSAITSLYRKTSAEYVVFVTKSGMIKKTKISEYDNGRKNCGIAAIKLKEDDSLVYVTFLKDEDLILLTHNGYGIHFNTKDISPIGRVAMGVKGIKLSEDDYVVKAIPIHKTTDKIAIFTTGGMGKRMSLDEIPIQIRGGKGVKASPSEIIDAAMVSDEDNILVMGQPNSICISASELPELSRISLGNIVIKGSSILSITKI